MIAFLHTSNIHINRFEKLVKLFDEKILTKHFVNEELLKTALSNGQTDSIAFKEQIDEIKREKPSLLICTCSTYGEECDIEIGVYRIDRPIVEYKVSKFHKIGLVYTAASTKSISKTLLLDTSEKLNTEIKILECDCSEYWNHFEKGNYLEYEKGIAKNVKKMEQKIDVAFLAQASMEGAKQHLTDFKKEIVSSPEFGVRKFIKKYKASIQPGV